jgi:hypothetical protein
MLTQYKWLSAGLIPFVLAGGTGYIPCQAGEVYLYQSATVRGISPERSVRTEAAVSTIAKITT